LEKFEIKRVKSISSSEKVARIGGNSQNKATKGMKKDKIQLNQKKTHNQIRASQDGFGQKSKIGVFTGVVLVQVVFGLGGALGGALGGGLGALLGYGLAFVVGKITNKS